MMLLVYAMALAPTGMFTLLAPTGVFTLWHGRAMRAAMFGPPASRRT